MSQNYYMKNDVNDSKNIGNKCQWIKQYSKDNKQGQ